MMNSQTQALRLTHLGSARLRLRQVQYTDRAIFERIFCDAQLMSYLGGPWDLATAESALQEWRESWGSFSCHYGCLEEKTSGRIIGIAGISKDSIPDEPGTELSWFLLPQAQGQGYASEITRAFVAFLFEQTEELRVLAETHPQNTAARHVLQSCGFNFIGERQHHYDDLPGFNTQALWQITRKDWLASHPAP